ncbi:surface-adhesin E family protein [Stenotrophomonas geniculata]|uniref:surface-adhesin E family protein n=1 Tax=Stenotrophomonas geniculata TaxID=86188 RepID=UPI00247AEF32|nr:surface-adhesin E family protein [Stenotrophomonas geniculata]MDH7548273.1 hypothetical protein [Stenotrophomonas geniculata]
MKRIAALLLMLTAGNAAGQDRWQYVGDGADDGFGAFLDTASLTRNGDYADAWFEYRYAGHKRLSRTLNFVQINCAKRMLSIQQFTEYGLDGKRIGGSQLSSQQTRIGPQTVGELLWGAACPDEARPQGLAEVGSLGDRLRARDPAFDRKMTELSPTIRSVEALFPPTLWAQVIELEYNKLR